MILKYKISTISYYREMAYQFCAVAHMMNNYISPPHNDARNNCTSVNRQIHYSKVYAKSSTLRMKISYRTETQYNCSVKPFH